MMDKKQLFKTSVNAHGHKEAGAKAIRARDFLYVPALHHTETACGVTAAGLARSEVNAMTYRPGGQGYYSGERGAEAKWVRARLLCSIEFYAIVHTERQQRSTVREWNFSGVHGFFYCAPDWLGSIK